MAYVFRFPADVTALVNGMEGTLCQTLAARGGTPSARVVKEALESLGWWPALHRLIAETLHARGVPFYRGCCIWPALGCCAGCAPPWLPSLVDELQLAAWSPFDAVCFWVDRQRRNGRPVMRDMWFQCECCGRCRQRMNRVRAAGNEAAPPWLAGWVADWQRPNDNNE